MVNNENNFIFQKRYLILDTKDLNNLINKGLRAVDVTVRYVGENYD
jgi:hypothetical protein